MAGTNGRPRRGRTMSTPEHTQAAADPTAAAVVITAPEGAVPQHRKPAPAVPSEFWKTSAIALFGVLLTGAASWIAFGSNHPTRQEVKDAILDAPYGHERSIIMDGLAASRQERDRAAAQMQALAVEQTRLATKVDQVLLTLHELQQDNRRLRDELMRKVGGGGPE